MASSRNSAELQPHRAEVPPEQQGRSSSLDQEHPEPPHIKEEQEELWSSQEGEQQLQGLQEADITKFTLTPVPVKSEDDEEKPQSSQLHQTQTEHMETEAGRKDCGGPEPHRDSDPDSHLQPVSDDQTGNSSEPETDDSADWKETREPQSGLNALKNDDVPVSDSSCSAAEKPFRCSDCGKNFGRKAHLKRHLRSHTGEKPFSCSVCKKSFTQSGGLQLHMRIHTGEKPFSCSVCNKYFAQGGSLLTHMRIHTGEKPFICSFCEKSFSRSGNLQKHMRIHTGEKPFSCTVCEKRFSSKTHLKRHMITHTGDKPFSCLFCTKTFANRTNLSYHMTVHTGEKRFGCSVCNKKFAWHLQVKTHKCVGHHQEEEQLQGLQEADVTKFTFTPVPVKSEDDEEKPQSSQLHQTQTEHMETEADGEDCGGPGPDRKPDPHLHPDTGDFSEPETDDSGD